MRFHLNSFAVIMAESYESVGKTRTISILILLVVLVEGLRIFSVLLSSELASTCKHNDIGNWLVSPQRPRPTGR